MVSRLAQTIDALYAVHDAIAQHLGREGARHLGLWVEQSAWKDAIEVRWPGGGCAITRKAIEEGTWQAPLLAKLDAIVDSPALPQRAAPGSISIGRGQPGL